jgi:small-conductance mechanosensitive channel
MKKTILTFGLISGVICSLMMVATVRFEDSIGFDKAEFLGYALIVLSFLLVFFGIRSYRDTTGNGHITFGKAFAVGIAITLITCVFYVLTWEALYFTVLHDFMAKYSAYMVDKLKATGASASTVQAKIQEMKKYQELYENPLYNSAVTFLEPFPVGLLVTLISALVLKKNLQPKSVKAPLAATY